MKGSGTFSAKQKIETNSKGYDGLSERDRSTEDLSAGDKGNTKSDLQLQPRLSSRWSAKLRFLLGR